MSRRLPALRRLLVLLTATLLVAASAHASGSYSGSGARPPAGIDADRYALGKDLFHGRQELPEADPATRDPQREVLVSVQEKLPERARTSAELSPMAGRLTRAQLDALLYFVEIRYGVEP